MGQARPLPGPPLLAGAVGDPMISQKTSRTGKDKKPRADGQLTALAGEFFVAAELLRRGLQCSITFGNAKAIDLFAHNRVTSRTLNVQVKALRRTNYFLFDRAKAQPDVVYVFVLLNKPSEPVEYFVVSGNEFSRNDISFGKYDKGGTMPGFRPKDLESYRDNWKLFDQ